MYKDMGVLTYVELSLRQMELYVDATTILTQGVCDLCYPTAQVIIAIAKIDTAPVGVFPIILRVYAL